jgi:hypothetical protein
MTYDIKIYDNRPDNKSRFTLGTIGKNPLCVIGLNPSTADEQFPDLTIKKVMTFAEQAGFDSFIMFNLYAQRTPYPDQVHEKLDNSLHKENIDKIVATLSKQKNPSILAGWGQTIKVKPFFINCLTDIFNATQKQKINWLKIGELTKSNHPRHPSRAPYKFGLTKFDINSYIKNKYLN